MSDALPSFSLRCSECGDRHAPWMLCEEVRELDAELQFDIVIKMPHVPMQTAQMVATKAGLHPKHRRIIADSRSARGLRGKLHVIHARQAPHSQRDRDMLDVLVPYMGDDRCEIVWHDCDTVMGVQR